MRQRTSLLSFIYFIHISITQDYNRPTRVDLRLYPDRFKFTSTAVADNIVLEHRRQTMASSEFLNLLNLVAFLVYLGWF